MKRLSSIALSLLLTGAVAVALATVAVPVATGTQIVTIDSNSMQKVLPVGSLAYVTPKADYGVGDVVTFRDQNRTLVTHEIVSVLPDPTNGERNGSLFRTQGTENANPDPQAVSDKDIVGVVTGYTPWMGVAYKTVREPPVILFLVLLAIGLWWLASTPSRTQRRLNEIRDMPTHRNEQVLNKTMAPDEPMTEEYL